MAIYLRNRRNGDAGAVPVVVLGAGPAGLAVAAELGRVGVRATVLERGPHIGTSWRTHYDHLRLHTTRGLSKLPGLSIPRQYGKWVSRDDMVQYLEQYAQHHDLTIRFQASAWRIEHAQTGPCPASNTPSWRVYTHDDALTTPAVVVATGRAHTPYLPAWPGIDSFCGTILHSSQYHDPKPYKGRTVLVVGAGNSGAEITVALTQAGAAQVWISVRTPPNIVPRVSNNWQAAGVLAHRLPLALGDHGAALMQRLAVPDLTSYGLPRPTTGLFTRAARDDVSPLIDHGFVKAVRSGAVVPTPAVIALHHHEVVLTDGTRLVPEVVVAATGYRCGLEDLVGHLNLLDPVGQPLLRGRRTSLAAPHLYFAGYTNHLSGLLRHVAIEARQIARAIHHPARNRAPNLPPR